MKTYTDEYLHHWGEVFTLNKLQTIMWSDISWRFKGVDVQITFEAFLIAPEKILAEAIASRQAPDSDDYYPLLPAQQLVKQRITQDDALASLNDYLPKEKHKPYHVRFERNGQIFEPYKYHRRAV